MDSKKLVGSSFIPVPLAAVSILLLVVSLPAAAQTRLRLRTQGQDIDFSQSVSTRPVKTGVNLPGSCLTGDLFFQTSAQPGENLFGCTADNVWTSLGEAVEFQLPRVLASGGVLSVGANCDSAVCSVRFGSVVHLVNSSGTAALPTGSGATSTVFVYIRTDGRPAIGINGSAVTGVSANGLVVENPIISFPADSFPLASCTATGGAFTSCTEFRANGRDLLRGADSSIIITSEGATGRQLIGVNPAAVLLTSADNHLSGLNRLNYVNLTLPLENDSVTGTIPNRLTILSGGKGALAPVAAENRILGVCLNDCGTSGIAKIVTKGLVPCSFDGPTVAGDYVQPSNLTAGFCTNAGSTRPANGPLLGYVLSTNTGSGTYDILLESTGENPNAGNQPLNYSYLATILPNATAPTPLQAHLAGLTTQGQVELAATGAATRVLGICRSGCGSTGNAQIVTRGSTPCAFDGPAVAGNYVQPSATVAGACHDAGATRPNGLVLGYVLSGVSTAGDGVVLLEPDVH